MQEKITVKIEDLPRLISSEDEVQSNIPLIYFNYSLLEGTISFISPTVESGELITKNIGELDWFHLSHTAFSVEEPAILGGNKDEAN